MRRNFLTSCKPVSFSRSLHHGVSKGYLYVGLFENVGYHSDFGIVISEYCYSAILLSVESGSDNILLIR